MVSPPQTPDQTTVRVPLSDRSYPIQIGRSLTEVLNATLFDAVGDLSHVLVISDQAVEQPWAAAIVTALEGFEVNGRPIRVDCTTVPSGEPSKSIAQFERLLQWTLDHGGDRRSVIVAVGGGVAGDLVGYVAASFARGIRFVQVPTTLLAMVDSSVGGKTGINLPGAKNMVGAFWQPTAVLIGTEVLSTLANRSYLSGLAEVIKYGVIDDAEFFGWLERKIGALVERDENALRHAIQRSCQSKARVVGEDERETSGRRAILNYGHTFAHAIEATAGYGTFLHGEAVSIGMQMAAHLAIDLQMCDRSLLERQTRLLQATGLPTTWASADPEEMLPVMMRDKKVAHGKLRFILPAQIGHVELVGEVDPAQACQAIEACRGG
ncbi:MAG: 3-dehydroquinate synthase [Pirellulales bacterium]|nr:3-dehydroquinate synthase [Pirellulales bacterium]